MLICIVSICVALPLAIWELHEKEYERHIVAWFIAGLFVLLAVPISVYSVALHIENYNCPRLQKHVVRIMWMPMVYGLTSWLGLRFKDAAIYFDTLRECYEAFVIFHFFTFLIVYLEQHDSVESMLARKAVQPHIWPARHAAGGLDPPAREALCRPNPVPARPGAALTTQRALSPEARTSARSLVLTPWRMGPSAGGSGGSEFLANCKNGDMGSRPRPRCWSHTLGTPPQRS